MATLTPFHSVAGCMVVAASKKSGCNPSNPTLPSYLLYCCNLILKYRIKPYNIHTHTYIHIHTHVFCIFKYIILVLSKKLFFRCNGATNHLKPYIDKGFSSCSLFHNPATISEI